MDRPNTPIYNAAGSHTPLGDATAPHVPFPRVEQAALERVGSDSDIEAEEVRISTSSRVSSNPLESPAMRTWEKRGVNGNAETSTPVQHRGSLPQYESSTSTSVARTAAFTFSHLSRSSNSAVVSSSGVPPWLLKARLAQDSVPASPSSVSTGQGGHSGTRAEARDGRRRGRSGIYRALTEEEKRKRKRDGSRTGRK